MKMVKTFDYLDIEKATGINIVSYMEGCDDSAKLWYVESVNDNYCEENNKINSYLLNNGACKGEEVFIYFY